MNPPTSSRRCVHRLLLPPLAALLAAPALLAQTAPAPAASAPAREEDVVTLSPFVVDSGNDTGYFSENTLAGSRLNTRVADLAASLTVVTKQQLVDTASIDMNDVFLYESNTEGTGNYTDFNIDTRGAIQDRNAGFQGGAPSLPFGPTSSNRVRGIGSVDRLRDYYPSNQRIPFDVYNTDSVEINRGPNSLLFGLGSAAGIVNQTSSRANLRDQAFSAQVRVGTDDAFRASLSANIPVIKDRLALMAAALHDERGFARQPAYDITRRQYASLTAKPFEKTTLRASFERYENENRRPNSVTPRDFVTGWIAAGRPSYNPVTRMLTRNGVTTGPYDLSNAASITALQVASGQTMQVFGNSRPVLMMDGATEQRFMMQHLSSTPATATPGVFTFNQPIRATRSLGPVSQINVPPAGVAAGITFAQPGVTDQSIYDWESINMLSGNFGRDTANIYNVELEQEILPNLHLQVGWYREDFASEVNYFISQQTGVTLYVDTDTVLLDGTPNPNFGRPYIEITQPDQFFHPEDNMTGRASLAYELDLTKQEGLLGWLGKHRLMGMWQHNQIKRDQLRYRPYVSSNHVFNPTVADVWAGNTFQNAIERRFYVGDSTGRVTQDPGLYPNGTRQHSFRWFNPATSAWQNDTVTIDTAMHFVSSRSRQEIKSRALAWQGYLFEDRIITTFGWRRDESDARTSTGLTRFATGLTNPANLDVFGAPQVVSGDTKTYGGVVRPFKNWSGIERSADGGSRFADFIRSLGFHYNKSDNFAPAALQTDFFNNFLPFPTGKGKDYGFSFSLFEDKLTARVNWYEASQNMARGALVAQPLTRTQTVDDVMFRQWAQMVTGQGPTSAAVNNILQLPAFHAAQQPGLFFNVPVAATSTVQSEGLEFQLTYNPARNWNIKFTAGQQETIFDSIGPEFDAWIAARMPVWTAAAAAGFPNFWNTTGTDFTNAGFTGTGVGATQRVQDWFFTNVDAIVKTAKRSEGKATPDQREWRWTLITNYQFQEGRFKGFGIGGAARWESEASIGYLGAAPDPDGIIRSLDVNRPVMDDSQFHLDLWASYTLKSLPWIGDRVRTKLQLNVRDVLEDGGLEPIAVNPNGNPTAFRIKDPAQWFLTATFDF